MAPQLATDCTVPTLGGQPIRITTHSLDRFQERMNAGATRFQAFCGIRDLLAYGMVRTTPRWWTTTHAEAGTRFVYSDLDPEVCLVVKGDAVATVLTRELCQPHLLAPAPRPTRSRPRPRIYSRRWDLEAVVEAFEPLPAELAEVA
jgi:hypothetical protein